MEAIEPCEVVNMGDGASKQVVTDKAAPAKHTLGSVDLHYLTHS